MKRTTSILLLAILLVCFGLGAIACNPDSGHTHTFSAEWSHDNEYHWHAATCEHTDQVSAKEAHSFGEIIVDQAPTPTKKGLGHKYCSVCDTTIYNIEVDYNFDSSADVTLLFDVRGGEPIAPITVKAGATIDLSKYTVKRTSGSSFDFQGWTVDGQKVTSFVIKADTVAHATYACDEYMGQKTIQFGKYPQSVVTDQAVIDALDKMTLGDKNSDGYYEYQGEEYAKEICGFQSNKLSFEYGKAYYFKVEPISWEYVNGRYTTSSVIDFVDNYQLLDYLNGEFYDGLTDTEKSLVADTKTSEFNDNTRKFYLWSVQQYAQSYVDEYDKQRLTDYALFRDNTQSYRDDRFTSKVWLCNNLVDDAAEYYEFQESGGTLKWSNDAAYAGKCGLKICFNLDFKDMESKTSDKAIRVTFDTNGGNEIPSVALIAGEKYRIAADYVPQKEGVDFVGWALTKDGDNTLGVYDETDYFTSDKDVTLYARWGAKAPKVYTIEYELDGGAFASSDKVAKQYSSANVVTFVSPQKASTISYDYSFAGWYLEEDFKTQVTSTEGLTGNVKLYAKWTAIGIYFTIEYDTNGGTIVDADYPQKVLRAEGSVTLPVPQKDGYVFIGWKTTWQNDLVTSIDTNRTGKVSLKAWYVVTKKVNWNLNGGSLENQSELPAYVYADGPSIDFTKFVPQKQGFKFLYWSVGWASGKYGVDNETTLSFKNGMNLPGGDEGTISAIFVQTYTLTIDATGGNFDGKAEYVMEVSQLGQTLSFTNPTKDGATLLGWAIYSSCATEGTYSTTTGTEKYFTVDGNQTTFDQSKLFGNEWDSDSGSYVNVQKVTNIYAIWNKVTISFVTNVDGVTKSSVVVNHGDDVDLSSADFALDAQKEGLAFAGWYTDAEFTEQSPKVFYRDTVLYAKWGAPHKITVVFVRLTGNTAPTKTEVGREERIVVDGNSLQELYSEIYGDSGKITIDSKTYRVVVNCFYAEIEMTTRIEKSYQPTSDMTVYIFLRY